MANLFTRKPLVETAPTAKPDMSAVLPKARVPSIFACVIAGAIVAGFILAEICCRVFHPVGP